ncbi:hypothetical protein [Lihuaxuella thermophila]|uniref:Uncharacterized protein n=1 Tax=Lihuaxuella thermophila TaxID=1173111 RepID=A0A1H8DLD0_9BACL|nr:hypothetical protein [Lihuaxuella thermophila]SEN07348.1 hypothetical protein SAMN05444955_105214 [Lihuaxuella thermophila]
MRKRKYHSSVLFSSIIAFPLVSYDQISDVLESSHFRGAQKLTGLIDLSCRE